MADNTINVAITSESVMDLKRAITVLKDAYRKNAASQVTANEASLMPLLLPQLNNLKSDISASKTSLESYNKLTLDELGKGQSTEISSFSDLDNLSGNYPVTPAMLSDAKATVNRILGDNESRKSLATEDMPGSTSSGAQRNTQQIRAEEVLRSDSFAGGAGVSSQTIYNNTYKNKKSGSLIKECIPCDLRLTAPGGVDPLNELMGILESDLLARYKRLLDRFKQLLSNTEVYDDLCSLLNFMNFQCLPDLYSIVALLNALALKLTDIKLLNPTGAFLSFITPFFAPMLNGLNDILDKYIQMIVRPVNCVLNSIDTQLAKLDVGRALDQGRKARITQIRSKISFLERKAASLNERRNELIATDGSSRELQAVEDDLREIVGPNGNDGQIAKLNDEYKSLKSSQPTSNVITGARADVRDFRNSIGSSLESVRDYILEGRRMIMDTAEVWKKELQRTLFGRAASTDEMLQAAEDLQKIARIIGIVNTMINFHNLAKSGKLCNNNIKDASAALGSYLTAASAGNNSANSPVVALGTDDSGNQVMLITSSDAVLELEGENQTKKLENLQELNLSGQAPNLGSLANVNIKATNSMGGAAPVMVTKFNLCGEVSSATKQNLDMIKKWASNVG